MLHMTKHLIEFLSEMELCPESPDASPPPPHLMRSGWTRETMLNPCHTSVDSTLLWLVDNIHLVLCDLHVCTTQL